MPSPKFESLIQDGLFEGRGQPKIEEGRWECIQIVSPAGTWYLVPERKYVRRFRMKKSGGTRAVFTKSEMHTANKVLKGLDPQECQKWLGEMIEIKEVLDGSYIEEVSK